MIEEYFEEKIIEKDELEGSMMKMKKRSFEEKWRNLWREQGNLIKLGQNSH